MLPRSQPRQIRTRQPQRRHEYSRPEASSCKYNVFSNCLAARRLDRTPRLEPNYTLACAHLRVSSGGSSSYLGPPSSFSYLQFTAVHCWVARDPSSDSSPYFRAFLRPFTPGSGKAMGQVFRSLHNITWTGHSRKLDNCLVALSGKPSASLAGIMTRVMRSY